MDNAKTNAELHQEKLRLEKSISRIQNAIKGINESIVASLGLEMYESRLAQIEKTLELDEQISNLQD